MLILGISAYYHDSAASLISEDKIIAAAQEERFTRKKHDPSFPTKAIEFCLKQGNTSLSEIDAIVFYDKPFLKFERLLETHFSNAPLGFTTFARAMPVWLKEKLFLRNTIQKSLKKIDKGFKFTKTPLLFTEHHLSHAASSYFTSGYDEAAVLTVDGVGEWATTSLFHGKDNKLESLKEIHFPHSLGLLYSSFTYYLGFRVNSGEYKLMGLAPYGDPDSAETKKFEELIKKHLINFQNDGSFSLNQKYFKYSYGLRMTKDKKWSKLFGLERRKPESELTKSHCNLALAIQNVCEEVVLKLAAHIKELTSAENLCLAGGVALNCVANGRLIRSGLFRNVYIQPASGDAGGALGAALAARHIYFDQPVLKEESMSGSYLGSGADDATIKNLLQTKGLPIQVFSDNELYSKISSELANGKVVGWFQGRSEFGPRALGNRSILADPRNEEMQKQLNLKIKYRESFRPFAPAVIEEKQSDYFEIQQNSNYMLETHQVRTSIQNEVPDNYQSLGLSEQLYFKRSSLPAITHINFSARVQSVRKSVNPEFWNLINEFGDQTGCYCLVNTSFNVRGEPIVDSPEDALRCFENTEMDVLVLHNYVIMK